MDDALVRREEIRVLRVRADMKAKGPPAAFDLLESKLPSLKGRKFYGTFQIINNTEEYYACVEQINSDDPVKMKLDSGVIPGGIYARSKILHWQNKISLLPQLFKEMAEKHEGDHERPSLEFYRSMSELDLFLPVKDSLSENSRTLTPSNRILLFGEISV
jgi:hypothetical protein